MEILNRDGFACQLCGEIKETLHVHHFYYDYGKEPWDYPNNFLVTLCGNCHEDESHKNKGSHAYMKYILGGRGIWDDGIWEIADIIDKLALLYGNDIFSPLRSMLCQIGWEKEQKQFNKLIISVITKYKKKREIK